MKKLLLALALAAVAAGAFLWNSATTPYRAFGDEFFLNIERGSSTRVIAESLAERGVISTPWTFLVLRAMNPSAKLQAGEYHFTGAASAQEVFDRIARGDVYHFDFTVPEGSNIFDIARLAEERKILSAADFLMAARDPSPILDLDPNAKSVEGYLFPSTYQLTHSTSARDLVGIMTREFRRQWTLLGASTDIHQAVTLASLVEKETGAGGERPLVASVFANRLKKPMRLECDPTVIYAALLVNRYDGVINRSDLDRASPYNTYRSDGLPPGPIASPGVKSLEAALHPAETDYLFFVAKPEGGSHIFSATLAAHQKAVESYRHGARSQTPNKKAKPKG